MRMRQRPLHTASLAAKILALGVQLGFILQLETSNTTQTAAEAHQTPNSRNAKSKDRARRAQQAGVGEAGAAAGLAAGSGKHNTNKRGAVHSSDRRQLARCSQQRLQQAQTLLSRGLSRRGGVGGGAWRAELLDPSLHG